MLLLPGDGERVLCGAAAQIFIGKRSLARALHRRRSCSVRAVLRVAGTVAQGHEQRFVGPPFLPDALSVGGYKDGFVLLLFPPFQSWAYPSPVDDAAGAIAVPVVYCSLASSQKSVESSDKHQPENYVAALTYVESSATYLRRR